MDIGTGKDLADYGSGDNAVPYHLIDICEPGEEYNLYKFQNDFDKAFRTIVAAGRQPILCGGTGMYIDSVVRRFPLSHAPIDSAFRASLAGVSDEMLVERLASMVKLHNHTDIEDRERLIRAIEIQQYQRLHPQHHVVLPPMTHCVVAVSFPRDMVIARIEQRLRQRLDEGMVDEVRALLADGIAPERLIRYGLEYRHITRFVTGLASYDQMYNDLFRDIRRFAKRQMTYLRHMERNGVAIHWLDGQDGIDENIQKVIAIFSTQHILKQ